MSRDRDDIWTNKCGDKLEQSPWLSSLAHWEWAVPPAERETYGELLEASVREQVRDGRLDERG